MPWTGPQQHILGRFNALPQTYRQDYQSIYNMLTDENEVAASLQRLAGAVDMYSFFSFRNTLRQLEIQHGFNFQVVSPLGQLSPDVFLGYLAAGRPIDDIAFQGARHGRTTHRAQWMMIALWNAATNALTNPVINLYQTLGQPAATAHGGGMFFGGGPPDAGGSPYLWDRLCDAENDAIENATRPEYLYATIIQTRQPSLYIAMR